MPPLASDLRRHLESVVVQARDAAEAAARAALLRRAVAAAEPYDHFGPDERAFRNRLRARGRQAGDVRQADGVQGIGQLVQELAYECWHRMLFARFLAENDLLMHPDGVPVSLDDCDGLAADEGAANGFALAARYARAMLPEIFRTGDVLLEVEFAPEGRVALERLLESLPPQTFRADDALGWVYQFWQTAEKDRVNAGGDKIDGRTLPAVTQLFTEHYMVQFLLHNTIGAWWAARHAAAGPPVEMEYLRRRDDGSPAAGAFPGWPRTLAEFTLMDPCCGSGHFLVAAFHLLVPLRMLDEGLSPAQAADAVLRDNLFGLELDPRCVQIAAFALALAAWRLPGAGGYRVLPRLNVACSGQAVTGDREAWRAMAGDNLRLRYSLGNLFDLFEQAPDLGSLIDPRTVEGGQSITGSLAEMQPLLRQALARQTGDAEAHALGVAAEGIARAAELLAGRYTLVTTNVPYLGQRGKIADVVKNYMARTCPNCKDEIAMAFLARCIGLTTANGAVGLVTPQNWLFQTSYTAIRTTLLREQEWNLVALLGSGAFGTISGEVVQPALVVLTAQSPLDTNTLAGLDVSRLPTPEQKCVQLASQESCQLAVVSQLGQLQNPDARVVFSARAKGELLARYYPGPQITHFIGHWYRILYFLGKPNGSMNGCGHP